MKINVKDEITSMITAKEEDLNSRYLDVYLMDDGIPIDLTGHEVRIYGRKPDGTSFFNDGEITDAVNGRCQFPITSQALAVPGTLKVEISIWQNNESILTTQTFDIFVAPKIRNDEEIESSNEYGALVILFQKLYDFIADVTELLNLVGQPADTGGTTLEGTVMAKINRLMSVAGADNSLQIKSLQWGVLAKKNEHLDSTEQNPYYRDIKINSVNKMKSIVFQYSNLLGMGSSQATAHHGVLYLIDDTTLRQINADPEPTSFTKWFYAPQTVYYILEFK